MVDTREEILAYLNDMQSHWAAYQSHKESSAWAGLALFVAALPLTLTALLSSDSPTNVVRCLATVAVLALGASILTFLRTQFRLTRRAANLVAACARMRAQLISNPGEIPDPQSFAVTESIDDKTQSTHYMSEAVTKLADEFSTVGQGARRALENVTFALVAVMSAVAVLWVWLAHGA